MAKAIEDRRRARQLSPSDFARQAGLTVQGIAPVRNGVRKGYQDKVRAGVARALAWPLDWYDRLLAGEDPATFPDTVHPNGPRSDGDRLTAVEAEVAEIRQILDRVVRGIEGLEL
jgi:transcriptional regulator with XRE-family HTH domain